MSILKVHVYVYYGNHYDFLVKNVRIFHSEAHTLPVSTEFTLSELLLFYFVFMLLYSFHSLQLGHFRPSIL